MANVPVFSKSRYLEGLQCPKLLWKRCNAKDEFPPVDASTQAIFDQGHLVTELAQTLFPGGVEIKGVTDYDVLIRQTQDLLPERVPLFEAAIRVKNLFARPDVLSPNKDGSWDIFEVKSSSKVKDVNLNDVAFQTVCYEKSGLRIRKTHLVLIETDYVRTGKIDPKVLFKIEDVTELVRPLCKQVEANVERMIKVRDLKACPEIKIGPQCSDPYECPLHDLCWKHIPDDSVFILNRIRSDKAFGFINEGFIKATDVPAERLTTATHQIVRECHASKKTHTDLKAIKGFLKKLEFPLYLVDFETINPAIPLYENASPFEQIAFQFSLHVLEDWGKKPAHHAFLAEGRGDPRPEFLKKLKSLIGPQGNIVAFNMSFELGRLKEAVEAYPEYEEWFKEIEPRFIDLIVPFRRFDYYDPKQMGSYSIKAIYPALVGGSYSSLAISEGGQASREYGRVTFAEGVSEAEKRKIYDGLLEYCKLDTQAMIDILNVLRGKATENKRSK